LILLDTHVLLWMDRNDNALGEMARSMIEQAWLSGGIAVSAISFWEVAMLAVRERIVLPVPVEVWRADLLQAGIQEAPLDGGLALMAARLTDLHRDPADRFIVATALHRKVRLITADTQILDWNGPLERQDARL
jgi:PIN domain nuclease of toxin-antitoxin system